MKKILYFGILLLTLLVAFVSLTGRGQTEPTVVDSWADFPIEPINTDTQAKTLELKSANGGLTVRNFFNDPRTFPDTVNQGYYQLGYFVDPTSPDAANVPFYIEFTSTTQHFIVSLQQEDIADARQQAEQFLLQHLDVTESELCSLSYTVTVPVRYNSPYTGQNLDFSFCPGAVQLQ